MRLRIRLNFNTICIPIFILLLLSIIYSLIKYELKYKILETNVIPQKRSYFIEEQISKNSDSQETSNLDKYKRKKYPKEKILYNNTKGIPLVGGNAKCSIYSAHKNKKNLDKSKFNCITMKLVSNPIVCLYNLNLDEHISLALIRDNIWEKESLNLFINLLKKDPNLGFFDIGANIGVYSLVAASLGHKVVAVEPIVDNLNRIYKAATLQKTEKNIVLIQNALSDHRASYEIFIPNKNQGAARLTSQDADPLCTEEEHCPISTKTILMDDLLEVTNFEKAIIKIDIEGHESQAFQQSELLFKTVEIKYIFMEWSLLRSHYVSKLTENDEKDLVINLIELMKNRNFVPIDIIYLKPLSYSYWHSWPDNILWKTEKASLLNL